MITPPGPHLHPPARGTVRTQAKCGAALRSSLPCRLDVLALLIEIDSSIGNWEPRGTSTVERLHQLAGLLQSSPRPHAQDIPRDVVGGSEQLGET